MALEMDNDVLAIKEWLAKEAYLPNDLDEFVIKKFLHSCYGSLEKTKKCIDKFCSGRYNMPELYTSRDPFSAKLETAFSIAYLATFTAGENEILMHCLDDQTLEKYNYYDVVKTFTIQSDYWLKVQDCMPEGHIIIFDMRSITLKIVPKANVFHFQKLLIFLLEAMPVRLKQVHVVNCPSYVERLFALVKNVLPKEIIDMISFHTSHEGLCSAIDKKYLPEEYGGDASSFKQQHRDWVELIKDDKKMFLDDDLWKADLTKKIKENGEDTNMNGSFRTLSID